MDNGPPTRNCGECGHLDGASTRYGIGQALGAKMCAVYDAPSRWAKKRLVTGIWQKLLHGALSYRTGAGNFEPISQVLLDHSEIVDYVEQS